MVANEPATILYVDDDEDTRRTFRWIFQHAGFDVLEAATGGEALRLAEAQPDVVILDVNLPDIHGFEVCRRIKMHPGTSNIPVLHLSAVFVTPEDRTQGLEEGADGYLTKPVEPDELLAHVNALLRLRQAEERARAEARHWQATFDALSDGVCLLDAQGRVLRCNQSLARLTGRPASELLGLNFKDLTPLPPGPLQSLPFTRMAEGRRREVTELAVGERWLQVAAEPLLAGNGTLAGAVYILSDITERKRLEVQLRHAQKMEAIGQLAGGVAHDFNNLLTAITGNISLVLSALPEHDPNQDALRTAEMAAWRAAELVRQLLGFSRQAVLWLKPTDLNQCIAEVVNILRRAVDPRIQVESRGAPNLWVVQADAGQLNQVLLNLCLNARDAMPEGGRLSLATDNVTLDEDQAGRHLEARPGEFVCLRVSDTGQGIPPEIQPLIYDPFFTTKPIGKGTGLGLAVVFGIVKQHQGWIECHSAVDQGTRFEIYLPRLRAGVPTPSAPAPVQALAGGGETILLVDDEPSIRHLGQTVLRQQGYGVLLAEDGQQAVEIYQREGQRIDLVVLDLTMPRLSGRDTLQQLRGLDPDVRVLLASGYSVEHLSAEEQRHIVGFLGKPYRPDDLAREVHLALDKARHRV